MEVTNYQLIRQSSKISSKIHIHSKKISITKKCSFFIVCFALFCFAFGATYPQYSSELTPVSVQVKSPNPCIISLAPNFLKIFLQVI